MNQITSLSQSIGISKNKTILFIGFKQNKRNIQNRQNDFVLNNQNNQQYQKQIDMYKLPPMYIEKQEEAKGKVNDIKNLVVQVEKMISQMEYQGYNNKQSALRLEMLLEQAMDILQEIEGILTEIENMPGVQVDDYQIQQNICKSLAISLSEWTKKLSNLQQKHFNNLKQVKVNESFRQSNNHSFIQNPMQQQQQQQQQYQLQGIQQEIGDERDQEIKKIVSSMQRLNQLFKQMSRLVIEQGSLLDRIDVNMDSAMKGVRLGKKELDKAMHTQQSSRSAKCMSYLMLTNFILLFILVLKYTVFASKPNRK